MAFKHLMRAGLDVESGTLRDRDIREVDREG
jgi:hypothetical protein